jgi:hypothetical protein
MYDWMYDTMNEKEFSAFDTILPVRNLTSLSNVPDFYSQYKLNQVSKRKFKHILLYLYTLQSVTSTTNIIFM